MPQETNLNVSPYFDDFDPQKNYYRVLFKPGYPVQARELTGLQSILQNQIEQFGNHIFKEGSVVIPGGISYDQNVYGVVLENSFNGLDVDSYIDNLLDRVVIGENSGVRARIVYILKKNELDNTNTVLYLTYLSSSDNQDTVFADSENLLVEEVVSPGFTQLTAIQPNQSFCTTVSSNSSIKGSIITISEGVYFLRGTFVNVPKQTLVLEYNSSNPTYRVGFTILEEIISADIDESLVDNAKGFSNYAAPGSDRLKITPIFIKIRPDEVVSSNFIELIKITEGAIDRFNPSPQYNVLSEELAKRTYDESGDYYTKPFSVEVKNSLDDRKGNEGIFAEGRLTYQQNVPSDDLGCYKISPGKAYIKGYEAELISSSVIDFQKPRETKTFESQGIIYSTGSTYSLNRVYGCPSIGIGTFYVSLRDTRVGTDPYSAPGKEIGIARVYDFALESGSYNTNNPNTNEWEISLYDIQTYAEISLNEPITLSTPTIVKGKATGATGYLRYNANDSKIITLYNINGTFAKGEKFIFNGIDDNRVAIAVTSYGTNDVRSVYGAVGTGATFTADTKLYPSIRAGLVNITASSSGISTVTSSNFNFGVCKVGDIVSYSNPRQVSSGFSTVFFAQVTSVSTVDSNITISQVASVSGICNGQLPSSDINPSDFTIIRSRFLPSTEDSLYTPFPKKFVSSVNLSNSSVIIRRQFSVTISSNSLTISPTEINQNEVFLPFDEERYVLIRNDGTTEPLSPDKFSFSSGGRELTISGLTGNGPARLIATLQKNKIKSRVKNKNRIKTLTVNKSKYNYSGTNSGIGNTTNNDGLIYGNYSYGSRIQDEEICLNVPEVTRVYAILESSGTGDPIPPTLSLENISSVSSTTSQIIIGEELIGETSGCVAICLERINSVSIGFIAVNGLEFIEGEAVRFRESNITAFITEFSRGSNDIKNNYTLDNGQRSTFLDYSKIIRKSSSSAPTRKLKIYFDSASIPSSDTGDIVTANSYTNFDYCEELSSIDGYKVSDILDLRPIVSEFNPNVTNSFSPFEFFGRLFNENQSSSSNILVSDESIVCDYSIYLGRIDRIYLTTQTNNFAISNSYARRALLILKQGIPSETPQVPEGVEDAIEIARVSLPPYLCNTRSANISLIEHKRYRMKDIAKLETRIKNLEYYTTLSLLENNTKNLQIKDASNIDRFKSGIFVDNFSDTSSQYKVTEVKNSIDVLNNELRPAPFTTHIDLLLGSRAFVGFGTNLDPNADMKYVNDLIGVNVRRSGINPNSTGKGIITLNYEEVEEISQPFATRIENVTPYLVTNYLGEVELSPSSEIWVDQVRIEALTVEGIVSEVTLTTAQIAASQADPQAGWSPIVWGAWQNNWTGVETTITTGVVQALTEGQLNAQLLQGNTNPFTEVTRTNFQGGNLLVPAVTGVETTLIGTQTRNGTAIKTTNTTTDVSLGDKVLNLDTAPFLRSRNIEFNAKRLRPFTQVYAFFDGQDVNNYVIPKLIEIEMLSGTFRVGEVVYGVTQQASAPQIAFRCATLNHRYGAFNNPSDVFVRNPYNQNETLPSTYTSNSTIINVDTVALVDFCSWEHFGYITTGMILVGENTNARARIRDIRLIPDQSGVLIGALFVPDPNIPSNPSFRTGDKTFKLTSDRFNSPLPGELLSTAETNFFASGTIQTLQETVLSTRSTEFTIGTVTESAGQIESTTPGDIVENLPRPTPPPPPPPPPPWSRHDPLAQSFFIGDDKDSTGRYVTGVDLYFQSKDETIPVVVSLRPMSLGTPTLTIYPFSNTTVYPNKINLSDDGSVPTRINFQAPVYLPGNNEHALVVLSESTKYNVFISRLGEPDITTINGPESAQVIVTTQPDLGSLFKSQNSSTWTPSQYEDLKFKLYTARFVSNGYISFFNPELLNSNNQIAKLTVDPIQINSKKIRVGLSSIVTDSNLSIGNLVYQPTSNASGIYVGYGGSATGELQIINAGIGYTPDGGSLTFSNVSLTSVTGSGRDAKANITIQGGVAIAATISIGGTGYVVGDVLTAPSIGISSLGRNVRFSVVGIAGTNELVLDSVKGNFAIGVGNTLFYDSSVIGIGSTAINGKEVYIKSTPIIENDGVHVRVRHRNHGMHSKTNSVILSNITPDISPATLVGDYSESTTSNIQISSGFSGVFSTFENVGVGTTNPGYALIDSGPQAREIISYEGVIGNTLIGITRGIDSSRIIFHPSNSLVYKYELGGVSLRRLNKKHSLQDATISNPIGLDYYTIKVDMSSNGVNRSNDSNYSQLAFNATKETGGTQIRATQNIPFEIVRPNIQTLIHPRTSISAQIRTTSGTSISGSEISFEDQGYQPISLNSDNYFSTPRIVASKVNEVEKLNGRPGNKSMEVFFNLQSSDNRLTPVIDHDRMGMILISNRVNSVIEDYATDSRVSTLKDDPTAFVYATKPIQLELPANSLRVMVSAYINTESDLRAFYAIMSDTKNEPIYYPFPGYSNLIKSLDSGLSNQVIDLADSDGTSDVFVPKNTTFGFESVDLTFKDYEFTIENLESFKYFSVKLVGTSTNQCYPPRIRDFRCIALR